MSEVIGRGVVEVSADSTKLKAGIEDAKRSLKGLGIAAESASKSSADSIDRYVRRLGAQAVMTDKTARETELFKLSLRGATAEQLKAADAALRMIEAHERSAALMERLRVGFIAVAGAGVAAAGAWGYMIKGSIDAADRLGDLSKSTGLAVEQLAGLGFAASQSGSDLDGVADAVSKLSQNIGKDADKFRALGVTATEPLEAFKQLADAFSAISDPELRAAVAAEALGKSWRSAAPLLAEGGRGVAALVERGTQLSKVTEELTDNADKFNDQLGELKALSAGFGNKMAAEMLPSLIDITKAIKQAYEESGKLAAVWTALGALGAFIYTDDFASTAKKIKLLKEQLDDLESEKYMRDNQPLIGIVGRMLFGTTDLDAKIASTKAQIESLQKSLQPVAKPPKPAADPAANARGRSFVDFAKSGEEAKARLGYDVERIRAAGEAMVNTYTNAEKIIEARRAAGLLDETEYYLARRSLLNLLDAAQEDALQKEIARLQREKLTGKDKLENDKKIVEAQAKLAKAREGAAASLEVLGIQEGSALTRLQQYYRDVTDAAQLYLETLRRAQEIELSGIGAGNLARQRLAGRAQIEDKYTQQQRELDKSRRDSEYAGTFGPEAKAKYDFELELIRQFRERALSEYDVYFGRRLRLESDWKTGAREALNNYVDYTRNIAAQTEDLFVNAFKGMEDALVNFVKTGKLDFSSLADSIVSDLIRIQIRASVTGPLAAAMGGKSIFDLFGSVGLPSFAGGGSTGSGSRSGGLDGQGGFLAVMHPQESVIDHTRAYATGGGSNVTVQVIESPGNGGQVNRRSEGGVDIIEVVVDKVRSALAGDITRGSGPVPAALSRTYGVNRVAGAY